MVAEIPRVEVPRGVRTLARTLEAAGESTWLVGGSLRDALLGRSVTDWDLATTARPEKVQKLFRRTIPTGIAHGTVTVVLDGVGFEVTTLRGEGAYSDGRRPDSVEFVDDITRDLERRDFTVNALALDLRAGGLIDPWGGLADLETRTLRAVRDPVLRFREDGLRVLRAARFAATLEFSLEPATEAAIPEALDVLAKVSRERVRDEWVKALRAARPSIAFEVMRRTGILSVVAPALHALPPAAFADAMRALDAAHSADVRRAALLGPLGAESADAVLAGLRHSNAERKTVRALLEARGTAVDDAALRRTFRGLGRALVPAYLELASVAEPPARAAAAADLWARSAHDGTVFEARELALRGDAIAAAAGVQGPRIRDVVEGLLALVDVDPASNDAEILRAHARTLGGVAP